MRYVTPTLRPHKLAYKGRRYWAVELVGETAFQCMSRHDTDYVIFDRLDNCPVAHVNRLSGGGFEVTSALPFPSSGYAYTLQEAAQLGGALADKDAADSAT